LRSSRSETTRPSPTPDNWPIRARSKQSGFAGRRFPADVTVLAVRWYLWFGLSYRHVEELLVARRIEVDPTLRGRPATLSGTAGSPTKPASSSVGSGTTSTTRSRSSAAVLPKRPAADPDESLEIHGAGTRLPADARRTRPVSIASPRAVRHDRIEADPGELKRRLRPMRGLTKPTAEPPS